MTAQTWLITGTSRGLGRCLALAALEAGDRVVATARRLEQLADLQVSYPDHVLCVALDVTDPDAAFAAFSAASERFGSVDIVVNNAGYANVAPVETAPTDDFRRQFETNFWGVYNVTKAALPLLKQQGGGTIVQISSIGGRVGATPGLGSYQAAKFAVDGLTRVLARETAPFGIRFLVVEPSGFDTDWAGESMQIPTIAEDYLSTVGVLADRLRANTPVGDPQRAAEIVVRVVKRPQLPTHLLLGTGAATMALAYSQQQIDEATAWQPVSVSADKRSPYPVDLP